MPDVDILGFEPCRECGRPVREEVAHATGARCIDCYRTQLERVAAPVELVHRGLRVPIRLDDLPASEREKRARLNRRKELKRRTDPRHRRRQHQITKAKQAALKRLRMLHPEQYDLLLGEERAKRGLEPFPVQVAVRMAPGEAAMQTFPTTDAYHAGAEVKHDPEAVEPSIEDPDAAAQR